MAYGIFGGSGIPPVRGLGGYASTIPGECWSTPGFKDCNAVQYNLAKAFCQAKLQDNDACIGPLADQYTMSACKCQKATASKPRASVVTTSVKPTPEEAFGPPPGTLFGMDQKTVLMVGLVGVGLYMFIGQKPKKGSS